ncbi:MAG: class I SAM-dependent methyltransferase family protein [Methanobacteriota archaeon]
MMQTETTNGIQVPFRHAEQIRKYLTDQDLLRKDLEVQRTPTHIIFPVKENTTIIEFPGVKKINKTFTRQQQKPTNYKQLLTKIPEPLRNQLPTSYDTIGDIILIKLPKPLHPHQKQIGDALLQTNTHVHVICTADPVKGELRTRRLTIIAGEHRTQTTHTEYGLHFNLDIQKTYFSPRLATERKRITTLIQPGETIVDLFTGVAPFPIMIARYAQPKIIYAIDKNKDAIHYAKQNIRQNQVLDKIEIIHADAKTIPTLLQKNHVTADRIIMNLPFACYQFLPQAFQIASKTCTIHYYDILTQDETPERIKQIKQQAKKQNTTLTHLTVNPLKTYAPREFYTSIDITAQKK